ncbi:MAG: IS1595 family transposase, partial [Candidatus Saccharimonadales bacterium]
DHFNLHLKECEFRYNMRHEDMYHELLKILRKDAQG